MRRFGLILVNADGFGQPPVARSVPHLLGLSQSISPDKGVGGGSPAVRPPLQRVHPLGWSADGGPGDGSLRDFATGAVVQHFPRSLRRQAGKDFRLPTPSELDALVAFQLTLGRQEEYTINPRDPLALVFRDDAVERGKVLFEDTPARDGSLRHCSTCHARGGANDAAGNNRSLITGAALAPNAPVCLTQGAVAGDGGFGLEAIQVLDGSTVCGGTTPFTIVLRGTQEMNSPSVVEFAGHGAPVPQQHRRHDRGFGGVLCQRDVQSLVPGRRQGIRPRHDRCEPPRRLPAGAQCRGQHPPGERLHRRGPRVGRERGPRPGSARHRRHDRCDRGTDHGAHPAVRQHRARRQALAARGRLRSYLADVNPGLLGQAKVELLAARSLMLQ